MPDGAAAGCIGQLSAWLRSDHVEPGARVITDGWQGYHGVEQLGYLHDRHSQRAALARGDDPHELLPAVHRVASLVKRWPPGHPPRLSGRRALTRIPERVCVSLSTAAAPAAAGSCSFGCCSWPRPMRRSGTRTWSPTRTLGPSRLRPPPTRGHPPSLERPPANRPWRAVDLGYSG